MDNSIDYQRGYYAGRVDGRNPPGHSYSTGAGVAALEDEGAWQRGYSAGFEFGERERLARANQQ